MSETTKPKVQCEGWRRHGGAFTLGPVKWEQCTEPAIANLEFKQGDEPVKTLPACKTCWKECLDNGFKILKATPI